MTWTGGCFQWSSRPWWTKETVSRLSSSVLPSSVWPLWEEATSPGPSPLSQQGRVYSKVMKNVGSAHLAGLGLWGSSTQLSISSQEPLGASPPRAVELLSSSGFPARPPPPVARPRGRAWLSRWYQQLDRLRFWYPPRSGVMETVSSKRKGLPQDRLLSQPVQPVLPGLPLTAVGGGSPA